MSINTQRVTKKPTQRLSTLEPERTITHRRGVYKQQCINAKAVGNTASGIIRGVKAVGKVVSALGGEDREDSEGGNEDGVYKRRGDPACGIE